MKNSSYSHIGGSQNNRPKSVCTKPCAIVMLIIGIVFFIAPFAFFFFFVLPLLHTSDGDCVLGDSLNSDEQMWCKPSAAGDVNVTIGSMAVKVYRVNVSKLPDVAYKRKYINFAEVLSTDNYSSYKFEAMTGSLISGEVSSTEMMDDCYFMGHDDYIEFCKDKKAQATHFIDYGLNNLTVVTRKVNVSSDYYFVVQHHHKQDSATATFAMIIDFAEYSMDGFIPACSSNNCTFDAVDTTEVIIAENDGNETLKASMTLHETIDVLHVVVYCAVLLLVFSAGLIFVCVGGIAFWMSRPATGESAPILSNQSINSTTEEPTAGAPAYSN